MGASGRLRLLFLVGVGVCSGCLKDAPETFEGDDPCDGSPEERACVTLAFTVSDRIYEDAPGDLAGDLHWGLYRDGDVTGFGPQEPSLVGDFIPGTDFSEPGTVVEVLVPDLAPRSYQVLGYLDDDDDGEATNGDPVHLPSRGFEAPAGTHTVVEVPLNYLR